jgi:nucleotidyltransferase/DNA polymerase involved in DNA repair
MAGRRTMRSEEYQIQSLLDRNNGVALRSNYTLYHDMSWRFQTALEDFSPDIEHYSVDEVFMKMPLSCLRSLSETGREMRRQVRALTGIPVSIGFGETKTLAKSADGFDWPKASEFAACCARIPKIKLEITRETCIRLSHPRSQSIRRQP